MRCKHRRVGIGETAYEEIWYRIDDDKLVDSGRKPGDTSSRIVINCLDCDYHWEGNRYAKSTPKWIKDLFEVIDLGGAT